MTAATAVVGVVGIGRMGAAIAGRLHETHEVLGWDVRDVVDAPIDMVATREELARRCDIILLAMPSPRETRSLFDDSGFRSAFVAGDCVVCDMSTSDPASFRELAAGLGPAAERLLDAPVLGRPDRCGAWTIPLGGSVVHAERAAGVLERLAARVEHVGEHGTAHTLKLLNNLMFAAINVVTAEAVAACDHLGLPPRRFVDLVAGSSAATVSQLFRDLAPRMIGDGGETVFTLDLLAKDLQLAARMCEDAGAALVSARASQIAVSGAVRAGFGGEDSASLVRWYRGRAAIDAR
ncbi:NAD(P)-dependent oxidoreductase [soil metagenome]